jgi:ribosomal protein S18 acetylase RimI-like enzyme
MGLLVNIDVPDLESGIDFYTRALGLTLVRTLEAGVAELGGAPCPVFLLSAPAGSLAAAGRARDYSRHWTPVHLDFTVDAILPAIERAVAAGGRLEIPVRDQPWGKIAVLSDPFGNGLCLIEFVGGGYDELTWSVPSGVVVRDARDDDYAAFARLFPELQVPDPVPSRERWQTRLRPASLVAERGAVVLGYLTMDVLEGAGYIRNIVSAPEVRRSGVGRALMVAARERLRSVGVERWCLNVMQRNVAALRLYESCGLRRRYAATTLNLPWDLVDRLPGGTENLRIRQLDADDDARIEATFDLPRGQVDAARNRGSVLLVVESADGAVAGFASFDPDYPGAFPFRTQRPTVAAHLLTAIRAYALAEHTFINLVIEDDPRLTAFLSNAGARPGFEMYHYAGEIGAE